MPTISILLLNHTFPSKIENVLSKEKDFIVFEEPCSDGHIDALFSNRQIDILIVKVSGLQDLFLIKEFIEKWKNLKVIAIGNLDGNTVLEFVKSGVRGLLSSNTKPDVLKKAIRVIQKGEIWIGRKTVSRFFDEFTNLSNKKKQPRVIKLLTKREKEILQMLGWGYKNKEIANNLNISEMTVKTHLYRIYNKIGVQDRLNAALFVKKIGGIS